MKRLLESRPRRFSNPPSLDAMGSSPSVEGHGCEDSSGAEEPPGWFGGGSTASGLLWGEEKPQCGARVWFRLQLLPVAGAQLHIGSARQLRLCCGRATYKNIIRNYFTLLGAAVPSEKQDLEICGVKA